MNLFKSLATFGIALAIAGCSTAPEDITTTATGAVVTGLVADIESDRGARFDGVVDSAADLDVLLNVAYGDGSLDLHRGHRPVENVLVAHLGISHDEMHVLMEDAGLNLAGVCEHFGFDPENLIDSLTLSVVPFLEEGVENGVLPATELEDWTAKIRAEFSKRVYWDGVGA